MQNEKVVKNTCEVETDESDDMRVSSVKAWIFNMLGVGCGLCAVYFLALMIWAKAPMFDEVTVGYAIFFVILAVFSFVNARYKDVP